MKKIILPIFVIGGIFSVQLANAKVVKFDHSGVKVGSIVESCYHNPCSGAKVIGFKKLSSSPSSAMIELKLLGYSRDWDSKKKDWNKKSHKIFITCSIDHPTLTIDGQVTTLPLNSENAIPGVLYSDYTMYAATCHGRDNLDETRLAKKYGYDVQDW
ncbi:MAG: hypothetical protein Q4B81_02625 [Moraxella sp.]|nr:hypothetical protein [Moraxella sp.]